MNEFSWMLDFFYILFFLLMVFMLLSKHFSNSYFVTNKIKNFFFCLF